MRARHVVTGTSPFVKEAGSSQEKYRAVPQGGAAAKVPGGLPLMTVEKSRSSSSRLI